MTEAAKQQLSDFKAQNLANQAWASATTRHLDASFVTLLKMAPSSVWRLPSSQNKKCPAIFDCYTTPFLKKKWWPPMTHCNSNWYTPVQNKFGVAVPTPGRQCIQAVSSLGYPSQPSLLQQLLLGPRHTTPMQKLLCHLSTGYT